MAHLTTNAGYKLTYILPHQAYYSRVVDDARISVVKAADEGGCDWEFQIVEHRGTGVRLDIFDDAWRAFAEIPEFFAALAGQHPATLGSVQELLDDLGFADATERPNRDRV